MASADVDITARPFDQDPSAPDPHGPRPGGNAAPPTRDDLDDLFNYDANIGDTFQDVEGNEDAAATNARRRDTARADADLGIDEEIKIKKPRRPIAKLDEERLLSQNGIPKLRCISKERLKFRGKGHEFTDVQRLLNTYQLWLDDLFPKAKFADGLALIEKVGHKKRLKVMRQEWINEDKPKPIFDEPEDEDDDGDFAMRDANNDAQSGERRDDSGPVREDGHQPHQTAGTEEDGLDDETLYGRPDPQASRTVNAAAPDTGPEEDELDQLLAEDAMQDRPRNTAPLRNEDRLDDFADDEEAMAGLW